MVIGLNLNTNKQTPKGCSKCEETGGAHRGMDPVGT